MKSVSFYSDGCLLSGHLYLPDTPAPKGGFPGVVMCHGFAGVKEMLLPRFAKGFALNGYAALTFDYRGFGESEGVPRVIWSDQVRDIRNAMTLLCGTKGIDRRRIGLWGTGVGGANAVVATARDRRVKCVAIQGTFGDGERVLFRHRTREEIERLKTSIAQFWEKEVMTDKILSMGMNRFFGDEQSQRFYRDHLDSWDALKVKLPFTTYRELMTLKPESYVVDITEPILIVAAGADSVYPKSEAERLFARANEPRSLCVIPEAAHYDLFEGDAFGQAFSEQLSWFRRHLIEQFQ